MPPRPAAEARSASGDHDVKKGPLNDEGGPECRKIGSKNSCTKAPPIASTKSVLAELLPATTLSKQDIDDYARTHGLDATRSMFDAEASKPAEPPRDELKHLNKSGTWRDNLIDPQALCDKQFSEVRYIVPRIIPEGVTLFASRPKMGKSWLTLQISTAVATGIITLVGADGQPAQGDVLYLALEDSERRLQRRLTKYFGTDRESWPKRLVLSTKWRRLDQGGIEDLREWCKSVAKPRLIAIDTLKRVRKPKGRSQSDYDADYEACEGLIELAKEFPGLSIMVVHHDRKLDADDVFDTVSGTLGLTGGVDTVAVLKRSGKGITLHAEGRDLLDTVEKAVSFDRETCRWSILGDAAEVQRSAERARVANALKTAPEGLSTSQIIAAAGLNNRSAADVLLHRMAESGEIERLKRGLYGLPRTRGNLTVGKDRKVVRNERKALNSQADDYLSYDLTDLIGMNENGPAAGK